VSAPDLAAFSAAVAAAGCNLVGVANVSAHDARVGPERRSQVLLPGAQSIVVLASGGATLWRAFLADLERDRRHLTEERNPLDAFVARSVLGADGLLGETKRRWFFAAADAELHLDFRLLGAIAGLGAASRLGLLLHPRFGPWLGLRAACFLACALPESAATPDLCAGCPAPCAAACPGGAFPAGRWDVDRCSAFHTESAVCESSCQSRRACPVGGDERYPDEAIAYHYNRTEGREWLRAHLGIAAGEDRFAGEGPHWQTWRARVDVKGESQVKS
jgi:epoxyqueuosine reductase QueG